jgi:phosphatidylserine decarboxylase
MAREGWPYVLAAVLAGAICLRWSPVLSLVPFGLALFFAFFFRNPPRVVPAEEDALVAPADGVVLDVSEVYEDTYLQGPGKKVSIFLSLFNVHINRMPCDGQVELVSRVPGEFRPAFDRQAGRCNSRNLVGLRTAWGRVLVVQITGIIARRIVCRARVGATYRRGEVFGLIKFGSCTELYLPPGVHICVRRGDKVRGGETIVGRMTADVPS